MPSKRKRGGRLSDAARQELMAGSQSSHEEQLAASERERQRRFSAGRQAATQTIREALGPGVVIEDGDWEMVSATTNPEGGGPAWVTVANTEIDGIPVTVKFHGSNITARAGTPEIGRHVAEDEELFGSGTYLTRDSLGQALRAQNRRH